MFFFKEKKIVYVVVLRGEEGKLSKYNEQYLKKYYVEIVSFDGDISSWCCFLRNHPNEIFFFIGDSDEIISGMELTIKFPKKNKVYHLPS